MGFFKTAFAAMFGFVFAWFLVALLSILIISSIVSSASKKGKVATKSNSVLVINLDHQITERTSKDPLKALSDDGAGVGLNKMLAAIKKAEKDDKIKGILLKLMGVSGGMATTEAIRNQLLEFKKSGKFILAYGEMMSEKAYYIATTADSIFLYPTGYLEWNGLVSNPMFYKGTFDKLEIEPRVFKVGTFKSFGESFSETKMSDANRLQIQTILNDLWEHILTGIAKQRKLDIPTLKQFADSLTISTSITAKNAKLIDDVKYEDEINDILKTKAGVGEKEKLNKIKISDYAKGDKDEDEEESKGNKIALIYAVGGISSGEGDEESIGSESITKAIRQARENESVKAIVLRINSGGGSALASDVIAREVMLTKKVKPIIASYGDVAASGGYYISAACDKIVCEPTTITGSIGVIGLLYNSEKFFNNKLGVTFDRVYTNPYADVSNPNRKMTDFEARKIQNELYNVYSDFVKVVMKGRGFKDSVSVDAIGGGRVWSGIQAKKINLVDELGGIDKAIQIAAEKAGLGTDYSTVDYPKYKNTFEKILENLSKDAQMKIATQYLLPEQIRFYNTLKSFNDQRGIYAKMLPEIEIK